MKKKKTRSTLASPHLDLLVLGMVFGAALLIWALSAHFRSSVIPSLTWLVFGKGALLLLASSSMYGLAFPGRGFGIHFLPLGWLAASQTLWEVCVIPEPRFLIWLLLFLFLQFLILGMKDGRPLILALAVIGGGLIWLFKLSFLIPLAFLGISPKKNYASWLRWGSVAIALGWFLIFRGYYFFSWNWQGAWDLWIDQRAGIFLLLALLGFMDPKFGNLRYSLFSYLLLVVGAWIWGGDGLIGLWQADLLTWVSILFAGFGFETLRRELLGGEWFHRWMGYAIGVALWGSVL